MTKKQELIKEVWTQDKFPLLSPDHMLHILDIMENTLLVPMDIETFKHLQLLKQQTSNWRT